MTNTYLCTKIGTKCSVWYLYIKSNTEKRWYSMTNQDQLKIISDDLTCIFKKMDIPEHLKGYNYFRFAIMQAIENP